MDVSTREQWMEIVEQTLAEQFADVWDHKAFDPEYQSETLEHFEPMVTRVFAQPTNIAG